MYTHGQLPDYIDIHEFNRQLAEEEGRRNGKRIGFDDGYAKGVAAGQKETSYRKC